MTGKKRLSVDEAMDNVNRSLGGLGVAEARLSLDIADFVTNARTAETTAPKRDAAIMQYEPAVGFGTNLVPRPPLVYRPPQDVDDLPVE